MLLPGQPVSPFSGRFSPRAVAALSTPAGDVLTTWTAHNYSGTTASKVFGPIGLAFKKGDVPTGSTVQMEEQGTGRVVGLDLGDVQTWSDGSIKTAVGIVDDDTTIAASGSRNYEAKAVSGSRTPTASGVDIWAWIAANADVDVRITNHEGGTPSSTVGGAWTINENLADSTINLQSLAAVTQRRKIYIDGANSIDAWCWGMTDNPNDQHLKGEVYIVGKVSGGTIVGAWLTAVNALDWIVDDPFGVVHEKQIARRYTAELRRDVNSTPQVMDTYNAEFLYHSSWRCLRLADDDGHALPQWLDHGEAMPTIRWEYPCEYIESTGMAMQLERTNLPASRVPIATSWPSSTTYVPGGLFGHRGNIGAAGGYPARGPGGYTFMDSVYVLDQATNHRAWRVAANAHHFMVRVRDHRDDPLNPGHPTNTIVPWRRLREGADLDTGNPYPDLPAPVMLSFSSSGNDYTKGDIVPDMANNTPGWHFSGPYAIQDEALKQEGSNTHTHSFIYAYALYSGWRYARDAVVDETSGALCKSTNSVDERPLGYPSDWGFPVSSSGAWSGIPYAGDGPRGNGHWINMVANAYPMCGDADRRCEIIKRLATHVSDYHLFSFNQFPQALQDEGLYFLRGTDGGQSDFWQDSYTCCSSYNLWLRSEIADAKTFADALSAGWVHAFNSYGPAGFYAFRYRTMTKSGAYDAATNPILPQGRTPSGRAGYSSGGQNVEMLLGLYPQFTIGEQVYLPAVSERGDPVPLPPELTPEGTAWIINAVDNVADPPTFQLDDGGGGTITFSEAEDNRCLVVISSLLPQIETVTELEAGGVVIGTGGDHFTNMHYAASLMAWRHGNGTFTEQMKDTWVTFMMGGAQPVGSQASYANWLKQD